MKTNESLPEDTKLQSSKYFNNLIEQDHRSIKSRIHAMLGFKRFWNAAVTISGIELMHRIRKGQFNLTRLRLKDTSVPAVWNVVLSVRRGSGEYAAFRSPLKFAPKPLFFRVISDELLTAYPSLIV